MYYIDKKLIGMKINIHQDDNACLNSDSCINARRIEKLEASTLNIKKEKEREAREHRIRNRIINFQIAFSIVALIISIISLVDNY